MTNEILSFKNQVENESGRLAPDLFLFFKKGLNKVKECDLQLRFSIRQYPSTCHTIKTNCTKFYTIILDLRLHL